MSLRERQKKNRREAMLDAARELFEERTYAKTTMDAIAEKAEVGIATLYNYFGTKEGVLAEIAEQDMQWIRSQCALVVDNPPSDPVRAIQLLFEPYQESQKLSTSEMISNYLRGVKEGEGPLRDIGRQINKWMKKQVVIILNNAKESGQVSPDLPSSEAADIILTLFNQTFFQNFGSDRAHDSSGFKKFKTLVQIVFSNWHGNIPPD